MVIMNNIPTKGICVDGSTSGNPGPSEYRGLDLETGEILFEEQIGNATNNIAEFLALCHAIHYCKKKNISPVIYSDSVTALAWVRNRQHRTTFKGEITERLNKACRFLMGTNIIPTKWKTKEWGEIPADYGRK